MPKAVNYIMKSGQSNGEGVVAGLLPSYGPGVTILDGGREGTNGRFGYEDAIIRGLRANGNTDDIVVSQWAWAGTALRQRDDADDWSPNSRGEYFDQAVAFHKANFEALVAQGYTDINATFIWDQGQADSLKMDHAVAYQTLLPELFSALRAALGMPDLHFHVIEISDYARYPSMAVLQESQRAAVAADGNATIYKSDGLEHRDYNHITEAAQAQQGEAILRDMLGGGETVGWGRYLGSGNDTAIGTKGDDVLFGEQGNDVLRTGMGADQIFGGNGNDKMAGGEGDDYLNGGGENDTLYGNDGNDLLFGNLGNDIIFGGAGADRIDGSAGVNTASFTDVTGKITVDLLAGTGNGAEAEGDQYIGIHNVRGGSYGDTLIGNAGANTLWGEGGADRLYGGAGNDVMTGGDGSDFIQGGLGSDKILGNSGVDTLFFASTDFTGSERDTVSGFTLRSVDQLRFEGYATSDITFEVGAAGTTLTLHEGGAVDGQILLVGVTDVLGICQQITLI